MICAKCRSPHSEVVNTRTTRGGSQIWRRRRCADCGKVSTTYERQDLSYIRVVSDNDAITPYCRSLLFASLLKVIPDSSLTALDVENLTDSIELKIASLKDDMISSLKLRDLVLATLKPADINAFMNYLVQHNQFRTKTDINSAIKLY